VGQIEIGADRTVRNEGAEADYIGDLGHAKGGVNAFEVKEGTAYRMRLAVAS
jgi:hypothetical protein